MNAILEYDRDHRAELIRHATPEEVAAVEAVASSAGTSAREHVLSLWSTLQMGRNLIAVGKLRGFCALMSYAVTVWSRKKKVPMDIPALVRAWVPIIVGLATAHDKDELDRCEFEMDEHLHPLLTAPVVQIREFYTALVVALKADPRIPFFVWAMFEAYGEVIIKKAPDGEVVQLKKDIAGRIADMVEEHVRPDIKDAIVGALQWRSQQALQQVETAVKTGARPRLRGRESCLFLQLERDGKVEASVML